jgi:hypothetical protein
MKQMMAVKCDKCGGLHAVRRGKNGLRWIECPMFRGWGLLRNVGMPSEKPVEAYFVKGVA